MDVVTILQCYNVCHELYLDYTVSEGRMVDEKWAKKDVKRRNVAQLKELTRYFPGGMEENDENTDRMADDPVEIRIEDLSNTCLEG
jgi:hypothetical protein